MFKRNHYNGMSWFEGVVESRADPLKLGRVQVRIFGLHTEDLSRIPTSELPWASVVMPVTSASVSGVGETPALVEGSHVVGFFRDGSNSQDPVIMGSFLGIPVDSPNPNRAFNDRRTDVSGGAKKPIYDGPNSFSDAEPKNYPLTPGEADTNRLHRVERTSETYNKSKNDSSQVHQSVPKAGGGAFSEPTNPYSASYPYNKVLETESGHLIEMDDTPGAERLLIGHRSGSYLEFFPDGRIVVKSIKDKFHLVNGDYNEHINQGTRNITVDSDGTMYIKGDYNFKVDGNVSWDITGNVSWVVGGDVNWDVVGDVNWNVSNVDWIAENVTWDAADVSWEVGNVTWNAASYTMNISGATSMTTGGAHTIAAGPIVSLSASVVSLN